MYNICDGFDPFDKSEFTRDFRLLLSIFHDLQDHAEHYDTNLSEDVKLFKESLDLFDKKYPPLDIELSGRSPSLRNFRIFFNTNLSLKDLYSQIISRMSPRKFALSLSDMDSKRFLDDTKHIEDSLAVLFPQGMTLALKVYKGRISLIYDIEELLDAKSPSFELCMYFALKDNIDRSVKVVFPEHLKNISEYTSSVNTGRRIR